MVQCMESLTQKLHPGVVINWKKIGGAPSSTNGNGARESDSPAPVPMEIDPATEEGNVRTRVD